MHEPDKALVTQMLNDLSKGSQEAVEKLMPLIYDELRAMAANYMRKERSGHTLQATELVNEAYLRLVNQNELEYQSRTHFFAIAATVMRRMLVDYARKKKAEKHGGKQQKVEFDEGALLIGERSDELLALDEALERLQALDERQSKIVELRYFAGLTVEETAALLNVAPITVHREWRMAKAWLHNEIKNV